MSEKPVPNITATVNWPRDEVRHVLAEKKPCVPTPVVLIVGNRVVFTGSASAIVVAEGDAGLELRVTAIDHDVVHENAKIRAATAAAMEKR